LVSRQAQLSDVCFLTELRQARFVDCGVAAVMCSEVSLD
jgi:hypothetical protein